VREEGERAMSEFKGRHFEGEIVLWVVRFYCRYGVSYRDLEQMMGERGVSVDHSTIYRWVQRYAAEIEKRLRWQWRGPRSTSWRVDETYVKVRGQWTYLYRAVDKHGNTIDFYLSPTRNTAAAKRFLGKAPNGLKDWEKPRGHRQLEGAVRARAASVRSPFCQNAAILETSRQVAKARWRKTRRKSAVAVSG